MEFVLRINLSADIENDVKKSIKDAFRSDARIIKATVVTILSQHDLLVMFTVVEMNNAFDFLRDKIRILNGVSGTALNCLRIYPILSSQDEFEDGVHFFSLLNIREGKLDADRDVLNNVKTLFEENFNLNLLALAEIYSSYTEELAIIGQAKSFHDFKAFTKMLRQIPNIEDTEDQILQDLEILVQPEKRNRELSVEKTI